LELDTVCTTIMCLNNILISVFDVTFSNLFSEKGMLHYTASS